MMNADMLMTLGMRVFSYCRKVLVLLSSFFLSIAETDKLNLFLFCEHLPINEDVYREMEEENDSVNFVPVRNRCEQNEGTIPSKDKQKNR